LIENFEFQDNEIPFKTFSRDTKKNTLNKNIPTLSHMHREMEILLVLEGEAVFAANGIEYIIKKGDIVTVSPYVIHNYTILADRDFKHNCLCFDLDLLYLKELKTDLEKGLLVTPFVFRDAKCFSLAEEAFHLNEDRKEGWKLRIIGNLSVFFGLMQENSLLIKSTASFIRAPTSCDERFQFSVEKAYTVTYFIPASLLTRRSSFMRSTPYLWPMERESLCILAHLPLPSIIIATCWGTSFCFIFFKRRLYVYDIFPILPYNITYLLYHKRQNKTPL